MKTTMLFRNIANPRRTTLAHLDDAGELRTVDSVAADEQVPTELPAVTANPRRTVLMDAPQC
ncbi:hypothetical protein [Streptomyces sp. bgisy100]|uniref:hypothetical protein n=1 Tax=Streptomyces sp. bgisy100 TaxID=3413783 RepID=UPI003D7228F9